MLKRLTILNYAIIEEISIDFSNGLSVITGETGAGKSILMGALSLILGDRADTSVLLSREKKCLIEGLFRIGTKKEVLEFLRSNDLDPDDELIIRREISANGKSRAFVNDTPVNLEQLRELSFMLVDLHRQFDTLELAEARFQREVLDALAGHHDLLSDYSRLFRKLTVVKKELAELRDRKLQFDREYDYNKFLFDELAEMDLKENELENLDQELSLLNHAENIKSALLKTQNDLKDGEQPVLQQLKICLNQLQAFASYHPDLPGLSERMQSVRVELQDIADETERINSHIHYDPQRIEEINEKIAAGYKLLRKHNVQNTAELIAIQHSLEQKLIAVMNVDENIVAKEKEMVEAERQAMEKAAVLSKNRLMQIKPLEEKVNHLLAQVGMPNARLKVQLRQGALDDFGMDTITFLFDANRSNRFEPLVKVASGGELSRLMLCIKSLVAQSIDLPTMIFDEIDTGISGEAAKQVGIILKGLSKQRQVVCITHQPQIAGRADTHYFVFKEIKNNQIKANIRILTQGERITTIAQMLGGEKPTAAALENAKEMVMN